MQALAVRHPGRCLSLPDPGSIRCARECRGLKLLKHGEPRTVCQHRPENETPKPPWLRRVLRSHGERVRGPQSFPCGPRKNSPWPAGLSSGHAKALRGPHHFAFGPRNSSAWPTELSLRATQKFCVSRRALCGPRKSSAWPSGLSLRATQRRCVARRAFAAGHAKAWPAEISLWVTQKFCLARRAFCGPRSFAVQRLVPAVLGRCRLDGQQQYEQPRDAGGRARHRVPGVWRNAALAGAGHCNRLRTEPGTMLARDAARAAAPARPRRTSA